MSLGNNTKQGDSLSMENPGRMHRAGDCGASEAGNGLASAPRAGAMFSGDDLNRKGYPRNLGHPEWLRAAYERGVL